MKHPKNANAPAIEGRGECGKLEGNSSRSETSLDYKRRFVGLKVQRFLAHALSRDTPEAIALANGAQIVLMLRSAGITEVRLDFPTVREAEAA